MGPCNHVIPNYHPPFIPAIGPAQGFHERSSWYCTGAMRGTAANGGPPNGAVTRPMMAHVIRQNNFASIFVCKEVNTTAI